MLGSIATKIAVWLLKFRLTSENRLKPTNAILNELGTIRATEVLKWNEKGSLFVQGREVDLEKAKVLRESARLLLNSPARKLVSEQVAYKAITIGVHQAERPEQMMFGKSAIWFGQEEENIYRLLAQDGMELDQVRD